MIGFEVKNDVNNGKENRGNRVLSFVKENSTFVTLLTTILTTLVTVLATNLYKLCAYWFNKGRYDYFNIPSEFIKINYEISIWEFLRVASIVLVVLLIIFFHCMAFYRVQHKHKKFKKIILSGLIILIAPITIGVLLIVYVKKISNLSIIEILMDIYMSPKVYVVCLILGVVLYYMMFFFIYNEIINNHLMKIKPKFLKYRKDYENIRTIELKKKIIKKRKKNKIRRNKDIERMIILFISFIIILMVFAVLSCIYNMGKESVNFERKISIIEIDKTEYIVVDQSVDNWIVKQCIKDDESLYINYEHFMLTDISEKNIYVTEIEPEKNIEDYMISKKEFEQIESEGH